jgi:septal ring factor EnvC (AmiA/AmiB activator)
MLRVSYGGGIVGGFISYRNETERKECDKLVRELPAVFGRIVKAVSNLDRQFLQISASVDDITRLSLGGKAPKQARGLQEALNNIQAQLQKLASSTREARREMPAKEIAAHRRNLQKIIASLDRSSQNQALIVQNLSEASTRVKRLEELYQPPASGSPTGNN